MRFEYLEFFPVALGVWLGLIFFYRKKIKELSGFIQKYWFYQLSPSYLLSWIFFAVGILGLFLALLDPRGPEQRLDGKSSDQRTVLVIDTSASMMVEDIRPNRLEKALVLARHFVKKAIGHEIAIYIFSDIQKKLVPFTTDTELLDSRIQALSELNIKGGGTGISLALKEISSYLKLEGGPGGGNILIFSDAEETDLPIDLQIPSNFSVAIVGIGTEQGGPIPQRAQHGGFIGNKKFQGKTVVSKLDEESIRRLGKGIKNFRYWIATSYSLPTEEILAFFNTQYKELEKIRQTTIKPVLMQYFLIPGLISLIIGYVLKFRKIFLLGLCGLFFLPSDFSLHAQDEPPAPPPSPYWSKLKSGEINREEKLKLAHTLLQSPYSAQAAQLYQEALRSERPSQNNAQSFFNQGTSLLKSGKIQEGVQVYNRMREELGGQVSSELEQKMRENTLIAFKEQEKKKEEEKKNQKEKKENQQDQGQGGGDQEQQENKKSQDQIDKEKQEKKSQKQDEKKQQEERPGDQEKEKESKVSKEQLPSLLQQLMDEDRGLQKKLLDTKTKDAQKRGKKDW